MTLEPVSAATAVDDGPQDGTFDSFTPDNLGSVNNNGFTSFRTGLEFSLAGIPTGSSVSAATLVFDITAFEGPRSVQVHGYSGDGSVGLEDFAHDGELWAGLVEGTGAESFSVDVTSFVADLVGQGGSHAGFNFREEPPNDVNFTIMDVSTARTALTVTFVTERGVEIDVRPSDDGNPVVLRSPGPIPVGIFSGVDFSAPDEIDVASLTFGRSGTEPSLISCSSGRDDLNLDGFPDLVCHFSTGVAGFVLGDTEAVLLGRTLSGLPVRGVSPIEVIGQ